MKRVLVFLLLCTTGLWAQVSVPAVADFDFPSGQNVMMAYVPDGYYAYKSSTASMAVQKMIKADSLASQRWMVTVGKNIGKTPEIWELQVEGSLIASPNVKIFYRDTVNLTTQGTGIYVPDRNIQIMNNGGEMTQLVPYTSTWKVPFKTTGLNQGDVVQWLFTRSVPVHADSIGLQIVESIDYSHNTIHQGRHYYVWYDTTLASANDSLKISLVTPATEVHLTYNVDATAKTYFLIREDVTITSGDTMTVFNSDRNSSNTSGIVVQKNATVAIAGRGTVIRPATLGASGAGKTGGEARSEVEIILKKSAKYEIVAAATAASTVNLKLNFYIE